MGNDVTTFNVTPIKLLRLREVCKMCGLSRSSIYRMISDERFPEGVAIEGLRRRAWPIGQIENWIKKQAAKSAM